MRKRIVIVCVSFFSFAAVFAQTVSGNGYYLQQTITPSQGSVSGNGYVVNQSAQPLSGLFSGSGFTITSSLGSSATSSTPTTPSPSPTPSSSGGGSYAGFYILPPSVTGDWPATSTAATTSVPVKPGTIVTPNGSSCPSRVVFSSPIDTTFTSNEEDVKKLEQFLNEYEKENLPVNGVYEARDVEAVKRWQRKYRTYILDPMQLREPTGTIYTLSMRHIERQTSASCGQPVVINACPFFKANVRYGDRGEEVKKVQQFLNIVQGEKLPLSGVFGPLTREAVKRFQKSRRIYVATFIPISIATGNWYTTTRTKANETIGCDILK